MTSSTPHVAPGQALGYVYQFDRVTYRLFSSDKSVVEVGLEHIDDVSVHRVDGSIIQEQDKSTITNKNPLSNRSEALWKTLGIWCGVVLTDGTALDNTEFHLVTNGEITNNSLADRICKAQNEETAQKIAQELQSLAASLRDDLKKHGKNVLEMKNEQLTKLLVQIHVFDKVSPQFGGDLENLQALRFFSQQTKVSIFDQAAGWVKRRIRQAVENGIPPKISRNEFDKEVVSLTRKALMTPLSMLVNPIDYRIDTNSYMEYGFVKQLDWVNCRVRRISQEIIHFIQAADTRQKWTDDNLVSESTLLEYEEELLYSWDMLRGQIERERGKWRSLEDEGHELLDRVLLRDSHLNNEVMPKSVTSGNYHILANYSQKEDAILGWHPEYKERILKMRGIF